MILLTEETSPGLRSSKLYLSHLFFRLLVFYFCKRQLFISGILRLLNRLLKFSHTRSRTAPSRWSMISMERSSYSFQRIDTFKNMKMNFLTSESSSSSNLAVAGCYYPPQISTIMWLETARSQKIASKRPRRSPLENQKLKLWEAGGYIYIYIGKKGKSFAIISFLKF